MNHNRQQKSNTSNSDRDILNFSQQTSSLSIPSNAITPNYDAPIRQSLKQGMPMNNIDSSNVTSISSADYALNVIFSQFEQLADAKMSFILNMGVVIIDLFLNINICSNPFSLKYRMLM
jgi:hypothetical protein